MMTTKQNVLVTPFGAVSRYALSVCSSKGRAVMAPVPAPVMGDVRRVPFRNDLTVVRRNDAKSTGGVRLRSLEPPI